jgi:ribosomal protein S21
LRNKHYLRNGTEIKIDSRKSKPQDFEFLVRKFMKKITKNGDHVKLAEKRYHEKPSEKKNRKLRESIIRCKKEARLKKEMLK